MLPAAPSPVSDATSSATPPLPISIGMPVRNEARFLRQALDSLIAQTGVTLEIILSDNASTDETPAICEEYCAKHPFIRYTRFEHNQGASQNFRYVLQQAKHDYFIWASGHDLWEPNYLYECARILHANPDAMIAFGTTCWIDADGQPFDRSWGWSDTRGLSNVARYFTVFWGNMNPIISLIRRAPLQQQSISDMVGIDLALLLALSMRGDFVHAHVTRWSRREFRKEKTYEQKLERYGSADFALSTSWWARHFPLARLPMRLIGDIFAAPLPVSRRLMIFAILLITLPIKYFVDKRRKSL
jgi:glycosyltransferase involved in cell wall biosynthesis